MKAHALLIFYIVLLATPVYAQQPKLMMPVGHAEPVTDILQSANKKIIVSTSLDHTMGYIKGELLNIQ